MKKTIFIFITTFTGNLMASDLIYKHGYEANALVTGQVNGLTSGNLVLQLETTSGVELLTINNNGQFAFTTYLLIGASYNVVINNLPNIPQQSCATNNASGMMPPSGVDDVAISCDATAWNWDQMDWNSGGWN